MAGKSELLNLQFIEARHSLIELAAFLDRFDRHNGASDFRLEALKNALPILLENHPDRARYDNIPGSSYCIHYKYQS